MSKRRTAWLLKRRDALPRGNKRWLAVGIAAVVLAVAVAWVLFVPAADWLARHDVGSVKGSLLQTARDAARGRLLTLGAGLFAAGALLFTARNFTLSREGQVTDRYTKAIEQLGSDKLDVRIGGIYALERVARDSARDHPTVMEVLTAFIREHSHEHSHEQGPPSDPGGTDRTVAWELARWTRPDVQAAVTVVGRRDAKRDIQRIDLTNADLTRAILTNADLTRAILAVAILTGARLTGADLTDASLTDARLDHAHLRGASLTDARLDHADLTDAILTDARLYGAHLYGSHLTGADLTGADLAGADLAGADLARADLTRADLTRARLTGADLTGADLTRARLTGADLTRADLTGARWPEGELVPEGWRLDPGSGRLKQAGAGSRPTEAD
jgi:uncharacterized protein YjbI with pentapeptide repeats